MMACGCSQTTSWLRCQRHWRKQQSCRQRTWRQQQRRRPSPHHPQLGETVGDAAISHHQDTARASGHRAHRSLPACLHGLPYVCTGNAWFFRCLGLSTVFPGSTREPEHCCFQPGMYVYRHVYHGSASRLLRPLPATAGWDPGGSRTFCVCHSGQALRHCLSDTGQPPACAPVGHPASLLVCSG